MLHEGIQSEAISKISSSASDKDTLDARKRKKTKLGATYSKTYHIRLDHQILTDHGVFYPKALYNNLAFDLTLVQAK